MATYRKSDDPDTGASPDRMTVFQQSVSAFNQGGIAASKARKLLAQLVHLFYVGETFDEQEASQLFFTISKLFQKENAGLRQMVLLAVKELAPFTDNVIMGTSVLMKDVQGSADQIFRPNALRTLCCILDGSSVEGIDRMMRQAIVDRDPAMSSAALTSAYHLLDVARDTVRRWATETQEAYSHAEPGSMPEFHALGLLYQMRASDRIGLVKLIQQVCESSKVRNPHALVLHIRYIGQVLDSDPRQSSLLTYLKSYLRHRSDVVQLEAAKVILGSRNLQPADASDAIELLQAYLGSPRAAARFAAIRALNRYAMEKPAAVALCNNDIEALVRDPNHSIATYAMTALLKTGSEESVDRLVSQLEEFMDDIGDDFRVVVIDAIRNLASRFPTKHSLMLSFFSKELEADSTLETKMAAIEAIADVVRTEKPESEALGKALGTLCDQIEDCEYTDVAVRILHMLGSVGPSTPGEAGYVRHIYNRVVLENSVVRAAAVSALARFYHETLDDSLRKSVKILLQRCLTDPNDEVRDRAAIALAAGIPTISKQKLNIAALESSLLSYMADPTQLKQAFDASSVPRESDEERHRRQRTVKIKVEETDEVSTPTVETPANSVTVTQDVTAEYAAELRGIPQLADYGKLLHSSPVPQQLTDAEMEYVVTGVVHVFAENIVLQYNVHNTYDCILENLEVTVDADEIEEESLVPEFVIPVARLGKDEIKSVYVGCARSSDIVVGSLPSRLRFLFKELDEDVGSEEEYAMDDLEISVGDYMFPTYIGSFDHVWDELPAEATATRQFGQAKSLTEAVSYLESRLGLMALDGTQIVPNDEATHTLKLYGKTVAGIPLAVRVRLVRSTRAGVAGKLFVRSPDASLSEQIAGRI